MRFSNYLSLQRLKKAFENVLNRRDLSAGKDRFTRVNLEQYYYSCLEDRIVNNENLNSYHARLTSEKGYKPRKFYILREPKLKMNFSSNMIYGKMRILCKPSLLDRPAMILLRDYLKSVHSEKKPLGVERPKTIMNKVQSQINQIHSNNRQSEYYIAKADIMSFYSSIRRETLLQRLKELEVDSLAVSFLDQVFKTYISSFDELREKESLCLTTDDERSVRYPFEFTIDISKGIPQGLPFSNILAELFVVDIEKDLRKNLQSILGTKKVTVFRYVDDFIIILKSKKDTKEVRKLINLYKYHGLELSPSKTEVISLADKEKLRSTSFIGFNFDLVSLKDEKDMMVRKLVSKDSLSKQINKIEKKFSDFANKYKKIHKAFDLDLFDYDQKKNKRIVELIRFRNEIDLDITGYFVEKTSKVGYGWIHYYSSVDNPSAFKLLDIMVSKFKKRYSCLRNLNFKSALVTYRYLNAGKESGNFYIPNLTYLTDMSKDDGLLNEFLYKTMFIKYHSLIEMTRSEKIQHLNQYVQRNSVPEELIDISRGRDLYVEFNE